ncbi:MAG: hypothetical protein R2722_17825 [Tessaracoccus sp.]
MTRIRELLTEHSYETASSGGELSAPAERRELAQRFTSVVPRDYARIMTVAAQSAADGLSEEEMTKMMMEAAHG